MKTTYELNYINMDGREATRTFYNEEEAIRWAKAYKKNDGDKVKLFKIEATEMEI